MKAPRRPLPTEAFSSPAGRLRAFFTGAAGRLFLLVLLILVPAMTVQVIGAWSDLRQGIATREGEVVQRMEHAQGDFQAMLEDTHTSLTSLVRLNGMQYPDNCDQVFNDLRLTYERLAPEATNIGLSDSSGNITCAVKPVVGAHNIAGQPAFQQAVDGLDLAIGSYRKNALTGDPDLSLTYPLLTKDGRVQTVIFVTFGLQWLIEWQRESALPDGTALTLLALDGTVLQRNVSGRDAPFNGKAQQATWYALLQDGRTAVEGLDLDGTWRLHTLIPLALDGQTAAYLHLGYPVENLYADVYLALQWRLALLALALAAALLLAAFGSKKLFLQPLSSLMQVIGRVQAGDFQVRSTPGRGLVEIDSLARAFDRMADALQQRELSRQQAQSSLQESEARFRAVFDNAAIGVAVMTFDRHIVQVNQTVIRLTGYSAEEMMDLNPSLLAVEEDRFIDRELFIELIAGKRDQYTVEKRYRRKDGSIFWGRVNFSAVRSANGGPSYTIGTIEDITEEKIAAEKLAEQATRHRRLLEQRIAERTEELNRANELLQQKAAQDAVTAERTRLARELHDAVTQTLFSATLIADVLPDLWEKKPEEGRRRLEELRQLTRGGLAEMRALLVELRPNALVEVPLPTLLRQLTEAITGRERLDVCLNLDGQSQLPPDVQVALYRIAQEALNNIVKHAKATQAMVTLRLGGTVRLTIVDNGQGFDPSTVTADHLGLKIMHERAEAVGAKFSVYSELGEGVQISAVWQPSDRRNDE